jgi:hypothetical protein
MTFWDDEIFTALGVKMSAFRTSFDMANLSTWLYSMT